jgi:hypothetical protein
MSDDLVEIRRQIEESIKEHDPKLDSILYNGGTVLALAATLLATAAVWPTEYDWIPRALSGLAAFLIAMERGLNFGARWMFHRRLRAGYRSLLLRFDVAAKMPPGNDRTTKIDQLLNDLEAFRRLEPDFPIGSGPAAEKT